MLVQKTTQQTLRRLTAAPSILSHNAAQRWALPVAIATSRAVQVRPATSAALLTSQIKPADSYKILVEQRKLRPVSPHLTIYQPQIPWVLSGLNRLTGVVVSGGLYLFGLSYLVAPLFGWHLESASLAAGFAAWPAVLKIAAKFTMAMPFTFHSFNGIRHLTWDTGKQFANKSVIRSGWAVVGVSVASALYLSIAV